MAQKEVIFGAIIIGYILSACNLQACLTTFINDKSARVILYNKEDRTLIIVRKNEKRRLGNQYKSAHFVIYVQHHNKPIFRRMYTCKQLRCGASGNVHLKISDIENGTEPTRLFHIITHEPHVPMVNKLPMMRNAI